MTKGIWIGILLHIFQIALFAIGIAGASMIPVESVREDWQIGLLYLPFLMGFTQLLYMIPAMLIFWHKQPAVTKGIAVVTAGGIVLNIAFLHWLHNWITELFRPR